jgi:hypothetical protein
MDLVVAGDLNKQIGGKLGISEITVKAHRGKMMRKMKAGSLAELVNMSERLRPPSVPHGTPLTGCSRKAPRRTHCESTDLSANCSNPEIL